ncbi:hypothetical protein MWU53_15825 [Aliiroseovarius sp. S1123]|nr:hypothetical protein [Aliiroseovarius sp. S1123]
MTTSGEQTEGHFLSPKLEELSNRAFELFPVKRPVSLQVCTLCCMNPETEQDILNRARDNISTDMLSEWLGAAFNDAPEGASVFFWFLPSIAKYLAQGHEISFCGTELALGRALTTESPIQNWNSEQRTWMQDFATSLLAAQCWQKAPDLDTFLCMLLSGGMSAEMAITCLKQLPLADFAIAMNRDVEQGTLIGSSAFWKPELEQSTRFLASLSDWFQSETLADELLALACQPDASPELMQATAWFPWPLDRRVNTTS